MTDETKELSCAAFQAQLPDWIESGGKVEHPHLDNCPLCQALLADLETIAEAARQLFPVEEPPDQLWDRIEARILSEEGPAEAG